MALRPPTFVIHETSPNQKKQKKMQSPSIKSPPFSYHCDFSLNVDITLLFKNAKIKPHFFNEISSKDFEFLSSSRVN
jgi:hypothetical protein